MDSRGVLFPRPGLFPATRSQPPKRVPVCFLPLLNWVPCMGQDWLTSAAGFFEGTSPHIFDIRGVSLAFGLPLLNHVEPERGPPAKTIGRSSLSIPRWDLTLVLWCNLELLDLHRFFARAATTETGGNPPPPASTTEAGSANKIPPPPPPRFRLPSEQNPLGGRRRSTLRTSKVSRREDRFKKLQVHLEICERCHEASIEPRQPRIEGRGCVETPSDLCGELGGMATWRLDYFLSRAVIFSPGLGWLLGWLVGWMDGWMDGCFSFLGQLGVCWRLV